MISDELVILVNECDKIIADSTGKLEGSDMQSLNAEITQQSPEFPELTEEQVTEQAETVCKGLYPRNLKD